jgi:hypothetical protein
MYFYLLIIACFRYSANCIGNRQFRIWDPQLTAPPPLVTTQAVNYPMMLVFSWLAQRIRSIAEMTSPRCVSDFSVPVSHEPVAGEPVSLGMGTIKRQSPVRGSACGLQLIFKSNCRYFEALPSIMP